MEAPASLEHNNDNSSSPAADDRSIPQLRLSREKIFKGVPFSLSLLVPAEASGKIPSLADLRNAFDNCCVRSIGNLNTNLTSCRCTNGRSLVSFASSGGDSFGPFMHDEEEEDDDEDQDLMEEAEPLEQQQKREDEDVAAAAVPMETETKKKKKNKKKSKQMVRFTYDKCMGICSSSQLHWHNKLVIVMPQLPGFGDIISPPFSLHPRLKKKSSHTATTSASTATCGDVAAITTATADGDAGVAVTIAAIGVESSPNQSDLNSSSPSCSSSSSGSSSKASSPETIMEKSAFALMSLGPSPSPKTVFVSKSNNDLTTAINWNALCTMPLPLFAPVAGMLASNKFLTINVWTFTMNMGEIERITDEYKNLAMTVPGVLVQTAHNQEGLRIGYNLAETQGAQQSLSVLAVNYVTNRLHRPNVMGCDLFATHLAQLMAIYNFP